MFRGFFLKISFRRIQCQKNIIILWWWNLANLKRNKIFSPEKCFECGVLYFPARLSFGEKCKILDGKELWWIFSTIGNHVFRMLPKYSIHLLIINIIVIIYHHHDHQHHDHDHHDLNVTTCAHTMNAFIGRFTWILFFSILRNI